MSRDPLAATVAANVRAEIARHGWTQAHTAERVGMSQQNLSRRLSGHTAITVNELEMLANALNVPPETLIS